jgi:hypothetical protein
MGGKDEGCDLQESGRDEELTWAESADFITKPAKANIPEDEKQVGFTKVLKVCFEVV